LLLADEPTGALDSASSERVVELLMGARERRGMTVVIVSYDATVYANADRTVSLLDGTIAVDEAAQRR
ncbi:MAG: ABC transporter, partial [Solirubrobacteraceae bacterium]